MIKKTVYSDEDIILHLVYFTEQNLCFIHSEVKKWSLSKYKKYLLVFAEILNQLHKEGIDELFAIPPTEGEEAKKAREEQAVALRKSQEAQDRAAAVQAQRERLQQVRQSRIAQAQVINASTNIGMGAGTSGIGRGHARA